MNVSVVYALPEKQFLFDVVLEDGASVHDAIRASGLLNTFPDLSLESVGIFGEKAALDTLLSEGDRVEIYRALMMDPKEARRRRG